MRHYRITLVIVLTALAIALFVNKITASVYAVIALTYQFIVEPKDE